METEIEVGGRVKGMGDRCSGLLERRREREGKGKGENSVFLDKRKRGQTGT